MPSVRPPTANQQSQQGSNLNGNIDRDYDGTVYSPGAGHSQSINSIRCPKSSPAAPHRISGGQNPPNNGEQRASEHSNSSDSGPPPTSTHHYEGGGHSVKRVGTDTLHPPTATRRVTGKRGS